MVQAHVGWRDCAAHCERGREPSTAAQVPEGLRVSNINSNSEGKGAGLGLLASPTTVSQCLVRYF